MKSLISLVTLVGFALLPLTAFADSDRECHILAETINPTEAGATNDFINLTDGTFGTSHSADDEFMVPVNMVAWGIRAQVSSAPTGTDTWDIILVDDAVETVLQCEILGAATTCSDTSFEHRPKIAAGSTLTIMVDSGNGATDPAIAGEMLVSVCLDAE